MKKVILFFVAIVFATGAFAQETESDATLEETVSWLNSKMKIYSTKSFEAGGSTQNYNSNLSYNKNTKVLTINIHNHDKNFNSNLIYTIPLSEIDSIWIGDKNVRGHSDVDLVTEFWVNKYGCIVISSGLNLSYNSFNWHVTITGEMDVDKSNLYHRAFILIDPSIAERMVKALNLYHKII